MEWNLLGLWDLVQAGIKDQQQQMEEKKMNNSMVSGMKNSKVYLLSNHGAVLCRAEDYDGVRCFICFLNLTNDLLQTELDFCWTH